MILLLKESRRRRNPRRNRKGTRGSESRACRVVRAPPRYAPPQVCRSGFETRPDTTLCLDCGEGVEAGSDPGDLLPVRSGICAVQYGSVSEAGVQGTWCQGILAQRVGECGQTFEYRLPAAVG